MSLFCDRRIRLLPHIQSLVISLTLFFHLPFSSPTVTPAFSVPSYPYVPPSSSCYHFILSPCQQRTLPLSFILTTTLEHSLSLTVPFLPLFHPWNQSYGLILLSKLKNLVKICRSRRFIMEFPGLIYRASTLPRSPPPPLPPPRPLSCRQPMSL